MCNIYIHTYIYYIILCIYIFYIYIMYIIYIRNGDFLSHWGYPQIIQATHLDVWPLEHGEHSWKPAEPQPQKDRENMGKQKSNPMFYLFGFLFTTILAGCYFSIFWGVTVYRKMWKTQGRSYLTGDISPSRSPMIRPLTPLNPQHVSLP